MRAGDFPLVLGGDCSINLGAALALRRIGRYGLAVVDASPDFRHPGNSEQVGAAGGEEVALATGRGQDDLTDLAGLKPYPRDEDVRYFGIRDCFEEERAELAELKIPVVTVGARQAFEIPQLDGFWLHLDADVPDELVALLRPLLASQHCVGLNVTIYDPGLDGTAGALLAGIVVAALGQA